MCMYVYIYIYIYVYMHMSSGPKNDGRKRGRLRSELPSQIGPSPELKPKHPAVD